MRQNIIRFLSIIGMGVLLYGIANADDEETPKAGYKSKTANISADKVISDGKQDFILNANNKLFLVENEEESSQEAPKIFKKLTFKKKLSLSVSLLNGSDEPKKIDIREVIKLTPTKHKPAPLSDNSIRVVNEWIKSGIAELMVESDENEYRVVSMRHVGNEGNLDSLRSLLTQTKYQVGLLPAAANSTREWKTVEGLENSFQVIGSLKISF